MTVAAGCSPFAETQVALSDGQQREDIDTTKMFSQESLNIQMAMARTLEQEGNWQQAAAVYHRIIDRFPKDATAVHTLAILYDQHGQFDKSSGLFRQALKLQPGNPDVFCDIGYSQYRQRRWGDAEMNLKQAIKLDDNHSRAHNHLGMLMSQLGKRSAALAQFGKAGCDTSQAHMNLAFVMTLNDRLLDARQEYEFALDADPTSRDARFRLQKLDSVIASLGVPIEPNTEAATPVNWEQIGQTGPTQAVGIERLRIDEAPIVQQSRRLPEESDLDAFDDVPPIR